MSAIWTRTEGEGGAGAGAGEEGRHDRVREDDPAGLPAQDGGGLGRVGVGNDIQVAGAQLVEQRCDLSRPQ